MKLPDIQSIRETPVGSGTETPVGSGQRFAMVLWEIGTDPRLKHLDTRIYFVLAGCRRGSTVKIGTRLIARYACTSQRRAIESLKRLQSVGYIEIKAGKNGARAEYRLTAAKFGPAEKTAIGVELTEVDGLKRGDGAQSSLCCPKCGDRCKGLLRVGWCRSCNWTLRVERIADSRIAAARTA